MFPDQTVAHVAVLITIIATCSVTAGASDTGENCLDLLLDAQIAVNHHEGNECEQPDGY